MMVKIKWSLWPRFMMLKREKLYQLITYKVRSIYKRDLWSIIRKLGSQKIIWNYECREWLWVQITSQKYPISPTFFFLNLYLLWSIKRIYFVFTFKHYLKSLEFDSTKNKQENQIIQDLYITKKCVKLCMDILNIQIRIN